MSRREDEVPAAEVAVLKALESALRAAEVALDAAIVAIAGHPSEPGGQVSTASLTALRCRVSQQAAGLAELRAELERPPVPEAIPPRRRRLK